MYFAFCQGNVVGQLFASIQLSRLNYVSDKSYNDAHSCAVVISSHFSVSGMTILEKKDDSAGISVS